MGSLSKRNRIMSARHVMIYSALAFLVLSLISTAVYYFSGYITDPARGFFESVSAFSTTGLSLFPRPAELPEWLRIFRAACQWIGGGMSLAILALLMSSPSGDSMAGETPETYYRFGRSFWTAFRRLVLVYLSLTTALIILLIVTKLSVADALNVAFACVSTGGMSPGPVLTSGLSETVVMLFMLLTSISYPLYYYAVRKRSKKLEKNTEVTIYLGMIIAFCVIVSASLAISGTYDFRESIELGCFQTVSNFSTTGFALDNISNWPSLAQALLSIASFIGGSSFSLASGIKVARMIVIVKILSRSFVVRLHPKAVISTKLNSVQVPRKLAAQMSTFLLTFFAFFAIGSFLISFDAPDLQSALGLCASSLTNTGNGFSFPFFMGTLNDFTLIIMSLLMLIGRLELYALIIPASGSSS